MPHAVPVHTNPGGLVRIPVVPDKDSVPEDCRHGSLPSPSDFSLVRARCSYCTGNRHPASDALRVALQAAAGRTGSAPTRPTACIGPRGLYQALSSLTSPFSVNRSVTAKSNSMRLPVGATP